MVLAGNLVPMGTVLVTPGLNQLKMILHAKTKLFKNRKVWYQNNYYSIKLLLFFY